MHTMHALCTDSEAAIGCVVIDPITVSDSEEI